MLPQLFWLYTPNPIKLMLASVNIAEETLDSIHFVELEPAQMEALSDRGIPVPVPAQ